MRPAAPRAPALGWMALALLSSMACPSSLRHGVSAAATAAARGRASSGGDPYALLSSAIRGRISELESADGGGGGSSTSGSTASSIRSALKSLSRSQSALKGIDGASHELYQRTHRAASSELVVDGDGEDGTAESSAHSALGPAGRAARSAARLGVVADGLWAAELCELVERPAMALRPERRDDGADDADAAAEEEDDVEEEELLDNTLTTGEGREVWLNTTTAAAANGHLPIRVLVLYERSYNGGAGYNCGGIDGITIALGDSSSDNDNDGTTGRPSTGSTGSAPPASSPRGRLLVILGDGCSNDLPATVSVLDQEQRTISLDWDGSAAEAGLPPSARMASVCGPLYDAAREVLETIRPALGRAEGADGHDDDDDEIVSDDNDEEEAAASSRRRTRKRKHPSTPCAIHFVGRSLAGGVGALAATMLDGILPLEGADRYDDDDDDDDDDDESESEGARKSLGGLCRGRTSAFALGPPPCLSNNIKADFVKSVIHGDDAICRTTRESIDRLCRRTRRAMRGNPLGAKLGWMSNAVSLTVSGVKAHAKGKKGGEKHLSVPGMVYLVRPRRYEGSSIHEVSSSQGAIKVRSAVLWQLNDVLLSKSLWTHHSLDAYVRGLNRVQLRSLKAA